MRKISLWAKNHKSLARLALVVIYIVLNCLALLVGGLLTESEFSFPTTFLYLFICFFLGAIIFYPSVHKKRKRSTARSFYARQKFCDFILAASSFCMVIFLANRPEKLFFNSTVHAAVIAPVSRPNDSVVKTYKTIHSFSSSMTDENGKTLKWKERKKLLKQQVKGIKKANDLSEGEKTVLIILSCLIAMGLLLLVLGLSCNLSCSGADGAAALVGIGGTALVIFLLIIAIRAITGKKKRQKQKTTTAG